MRKMVRPGIGGLQIVPASLAFVIFHGGLTTDAVVSWLTTGLGCVGLFVGWMFC